MHPFHLGREMKARMKGALICLQACVRSSLGTQSAGGGSNANVFSSLAFGVPCHGILGDAWLLHNEKGMWCISYDYLAMNEAFCCSV
uniref:Uncharacterized protein n=1 Tax=Arundo donax TaxID=35708 RepID=A0A0A9G7B5_ARUDO